MFALGDRSPVLEGDEHFIADNASIIGSVRLGARASVWFNCVLRGDNDWINIGECSNIQDGSVLHTDPGLPLTVGNNVTVGHKVMLHGCHIGDGSLIGIGSTILNRASVAANCVVGAHSLITEGKEFPAGSLIMGAPAKVVRALDADEIRALQMSADHYVANAARYREQLAII
tara:strand:- start:384 stop:902 length:519 start_codon:yes stop_codon:yes gene_type:complete